MSALLTPSQVDPWLMWRLAGTLLLAGAASWVFLDWLDDGHRRPALWTLSQLGFIVLAPGVVAGIATRFRPQRGEWLALGLIAATTMAVVFAHNAYDQLSYDNSREVVLSGTTSTFVTTLCAGMALVLATYVVARRRTVRVEG